MGLFSASDGLLYLIIIACARRTADEVAKETGKKQLGSYHHHCQRDVEIWRVGHKALRDAAAQGDELAGSDDGCGDEHGPAVFHAEKGGKKLAAGHEAAATVDAEEDQNDDGCYRRDDVLVIVEAIRIKARQRDGVCAV